MVIHRFKAVDCKDCAMVKHALFIASQTVVVPGDKDRSDNNSRALFGQLRTSQRQKIFDNSAELQEHEESDEGYRGVEEMAVLEGRHQGGESSNGGG